MSNSNSNLDERFDRLADKLEKNHMELIVKLHELDSKVDRHEHNFRIFKWMAPPGAMLGAVAFFRDFFKS